MKTFNSFNSSSRPATQAIWGGLSILSSLYAFTGAQAAFSLTDTAFAYTPPPAYNPDSDPIASLHKQMGEALEAGDTQRVAELQKKMNDLLAKAQNLALGATLQQQSREAAQLNQAIQASRPSGQSASAAKRPFSADFEGSRAPASKASASFSSHSSSWTTPEASRSTPALPSTTLQSECSAAPSTLNAYGSESALTAQAPATFAQTTSTGVPLTGSGTFNNYQELPSVSSGLVSGSGSNQSYDPFSTPAETITKKTERASTPTQAPTAKVISSEFSRPLYAEKNLVKTQTSPQQPSAKPVGDKNATSASATPSSSAASPKKTAETSSTSSSTNASSPSSGFTSRKSRHSSKSSNSAKSSNNVTSSLPTSTSSTPAPYSQEQLQRDIQSNIQEVMQSALTETTGMIMGSLMKHPATGSLPSEDDYNSFEWLFIDLAQRKRDEAARQGKMVPLGTEFNKQLENYKKHLKDFWTAGVETLKTPSASSSVSP